MPNPEARTLSIRFALAGEDKLSSSEFLDLVQIIDGIARAVVESEIQQLLEVLQVPGELRLPVLRDTARIGRRGPAPTQIIAVERGSWTIETLLSSVAVIWFMKHFIGAPILAAWDESRLRHRVESFIRDRAFQGARQSVELKAAQKPRTGSLEISQVEEESGSTPEARSLAVRVTRSTVIEVELSDREVIEEFIQELKRIQG